MSSTFSVHQQIGEDYQNVCRLCLKKASLKIDIYKEEGLRRNISGKILNCLSLIVTEDDILPKFVCMEKLENFQNFRDVCHKSENLLTSYLSAMEESRRKQESHELKLKAVKQRISSVLPTLDDVILDTVANKLLDSGVEEEEDLRYVQECDLLSILKPVQVRKLLGAWKGVGEPSEEVASPKQAPAAANTTFTPKADPQCSNVDPNWPYTFQVPWDSMPRALMNDLQRNRRPAPGARRQMVRIIVDHIHRICRRPQKKQMEVVARAITQEFPECFQDRIDGTVVGTGFLSLQRQLSVRSENANRKVEHGKRSRKMPACEANVARCIGRNRYGCVNWQPREPDEEDSNAVAFYRQRRLINSGASIHEIQENDPGLFDGQAILSHFTELVNIDIKQTLRTTFSTKGPRLVKFLQLSCLNHTQELCQDVEHNDEDVRNHPAILLKLLQAYFQEDEVLFRYVEDTTLPWEVASEMLPDTPCLVVCGSSLNECRRFMLSLEQEVRIEAIVDFLDAVSVLFACFYVFNMDYPTEAQYTLEFVQRCLIGINPVGGSKIEKSRRKSYTISPKVLRLLNALANF